MLGYDIVLRRQLRAPYTATLGAVVLAGYGLGALVGWLIRWTDDDTAELDTVIRDAPKIVR